MLYMSHYYMQEDFSKYKVISLPDFGLVKLVEFTITVVWIQVRTFVLSMSRCPTDIEDTFHPFFCELLSTSSGVDSFDRVLLYQCIPLQTVCYQM